MITVFFSNGSSKEYLDAISARIEGGQFVCRNMHGEPVACFPKPSVLSYGSDLIARRAGKEFPEPSKEILRSLLERRTGRWTFKRRR